MSFGRVNQQWATFTKSWHILNAYQQPPGKIAAICADYLQGKHKPIFDNSGSIGDHVVVVNSKFISFSGSKWEEKQFFSDNGRPKGRLRMEAWKIHELDPTWIVKRITYRNLSKVPEFRRDLFHCLHVFEDENVPGEILENVSNVITPPRRLPKSWNDYTKEEIENFPKLFVPSPDFVKRWRENDLY